MNKEYHRQKAKDHYQKHKNAYKERNKKRREELTKFVNDLKASFGCFLCQEKDSACLDFHHLDDKEETISDIMQRSVGVILTEAKKCIIICSNCHRKHHYHKTKILVDLDRYWINY